MARAPLASPDLVIESATGVDVALQIAGPGARSLAFVIDWSIRALFFVAWYAAAAAIFNGRLDLSPPLEASGLWFAAVFVPPVAIFFLYHYVLEIAMRGRTPGKRAAGVRVVMRSGATPSAGALLMRNLFRIVDSFPLFYTVGLGATLITRERVRIGDLAAGTLLVYEHRAGAVLEHMRADSMAAALDARSTEIAAELLDRWPALDPRARQTLASRILTARGYPLPDQDDALRAALRELTSGRAA